MDLRHMIAFFAVVVLCMGAILGDRWLLPRLLPGPQQAWTQSDLRRVTMISVGGMIAGVIAVSALLWLGLQ
jgi:hypothetical protein